VGVGRVGVESIGIESVGIGTVGVESMRSVWSRGATVGALAECVMSGGGASAVGAGSSRSGCAALGVGRDEG
jgi:hypothetical protein